MYFQIENTPERLKRARKKDLVSENMPKEECPRLVLAPFSRPPQVVFDNVPLGTTCNKELEILNPLKHTQQITLDKTMPPGLNIHLPEESLEVKPGTCYCLNMTWTPIQLTAIRETIHFSNNNRGRYEVNVVLKSVMNIKCKNSHPKFKVSPGKIKKKTEKRSPVAINKKKIEAIRKSTTVRKNFIVFESTLNKVISSNKENTPLTSKENILSYDYTFDSNLKRCPFDEASDLEFNSSEVFPNIKRSKEPVLHQTYDKSFDISNYDKWTDPASKNVLKPSNKQDTSVTDIIDNLIFTPVKSVPLKNDKLEKGPKIILSINSESDFDDSLDIKNSNKENESHSFLCVTSSQQSNKWLSVNHAVQYNTNQCSDTPTTRHKKIPNTSSPKDINSPNFSINTEFSRISELSFFPQRFSTDKKALPKINNDTHDIINDSNVTVKVSSDTYTKESNTPHNFHDNQMTSESKNVPLIKEQHSKICQKALFKEQPPHRETFERNYLSRPEYYPWHNDLRVDVRSPPRSLTPPLQSIPEESLQYSESHILDKTDYHKNKSTFTINRTFDKRKDLCSTRINCQTSWSKVAHGADKILWNIQAPKDKTCSNKSKEQSIKGKLNDTNKIDKNANRNSYLNYIDNVYSQSLTVDPFLSSTYFYDREEVDHIEREFKRWLNWILTPPADLDSNTDQQIDVGKIWFENRNKEVPVAPTKEQVCSAYHNNHRLDSLRRSARNFLHSPEISQVFIRLSAQIDKKLISIRHDRNLHLDIGLQKIIMEILLSYNPLWLRIALEAIYGLVLPLKSNSDIEGLTTFIIQRMFKNPYLRNKNSKASAPNMLLPAYMEAIKKFTLKKFFILVFFLDKAKQKKLIPHDPCLFRRNATCKESRDILIRFTRELIAGIGDITKHLRPLGYVVSHKQSYLDEYIYAVHNIAVDVRDGVRLTKVMEVILMKNSLLHQLRTPAISRYQKIHNVQVAFNALKEANFVIVGDITARDIVDGHREKTLSLLWQIIHVFRAPLFEKAANVIQTWWRKKYEVIVEKRKAEERELVKLNTAASIIQYWWRRIQYSRLVEHQMHQITIATTIIQKYCRMWLCRRRLTKLKNSAMKIAEWYRNVKMMHKAKETLQVLKTQRKEIRNQSATIIQRCVRRWLCVKGYGEMKNKIILIQSHVKGYLTRKRYIILKKYTIYIQQRYRSKLLMKKEMHILAKKKECAVRIQSYYRKYRERKHYKNLKKSVQTIEKFYLAAILKRKDRNYFLQLKRAAIKIQSKYRCKKMRIEYLRQRTLIINLQRKIRAHRAMKQCRLNFLELRLKTMTIQNRIKAFLAMRSARREFTTMKKSAVVLQRFFRSYLLMKSQRNSFINMKKSATLIQVKYRGLVTMRQERTNFVRLKNATVFIQRRYRALLEMRKERLNYIRLRTSSILIQSTFKAYLVGKRQRKLFLKQKESAIKIQRWIKRMKTVKAIRSIYEQRNKAAVTIQTAYKAYIAGKKQKLKYLEIKTATVFIQKYFKNYLLKKANRKEFLELRSSTITIQKFYRCWQETQKQRKKYLKIKQAAIVIQTYYRNYRLGKAIRHEFCQLKLATILIQQRFRSLISMKQRQNLIRMNNAARVIQRRYREVREARKLRNHYTQLRNATILIQRHIRNRNQAQEIARKMAVDKIETWYMSIKQRDKCRSRFVDIKTKVITLQANIRMCIQRKRYIAIKNGAITIQTTYRYYKLAKIERENYLHIRRSVIKVQAYVRAFIQRRRFTRLRSAALVIQAVCRLRRHKAIRATRRETAAVCLQKNVRCYLAKLQFKRIIKEVIFIQRVWRSKLLTRRVRSEYLQRKQLVLKLQSLMKGYLARQKFERSKENLSKLKEERRRQWAASKIQALFRGNKVRIASVPAVSKLRQRWRAGGLESTQPSLKERNEEALEILQHMSDIESVIRAFKSIEYITKVKPMMYDANASSVVRQIYLYMSVMNRSISSVEVLKSAAAVLVNLTRYRITGPKIYARDRISSALKFMWRFSGSETQLFCILATYIWLFSKYDIVKKDLTEFLNITENHKMLTTIKGNICRMKRMANARIKPSHTPQPTKFVSHTMNHSLRDNLSVNISSTSTSYVLPTIEPDYGITRADKPCYFEDAQQAITCLFETYRL